MGLGTGGFSRGVGERLGGVAYITPSVEAHEQAISEEVVRKLFEHAKGDITGATVKGVANITVEPHPRQIATVYLTAPSKSGNPLVVRANIGRKISDVVSSVVSVVIDVNTDGVISRRIKTVPIPGHQEGSNTFSFRAASHVANEIANDFMSEDSLRAKFSRISGIRK